jgi:DNA-directed RNA polymerase subunit M/transcription elongation factor TFIIS
MESVEHWQQLKENYTQMTEGELCALAEDAYDLTESAREALKTVLSERGIAVRLKLEPPAESAKDEGLIILTRHGWPANAEAAWLMMGSLSAAGIPSFLGPVNVMHLEEFQGKFDGPVSLKIRDVDQERAFLALRDSELQEPPAPPSVEPPEDDEGLINFQWPDNAEHAWRWMRALTAAGIPSFLGPDNVMHLEEFQGKFDGPVSLKIRDVDRDRAYAAVARARARARANDGNEKESEDKKDYAILCPKCRSAKVVLKGRDSMLAEPPPTAKFLWSCDACGHQWVDEGILQEAAGGQSWPGEEFPSRDKDSSKWNPK